MKQEITADIANAFNTDLADVVKDFTGRRVILSDDDWAVNDTQVLSTINYSGRGVFTGFTKMPIISALAVLAMPRQAVALSLS